MKKGDDDDFGDKWPVRNNEWTVTFLVVDSVTHCKPCNKKAVHIMEEYEEEQKKTKSKYKYNTWGRSIKSTTDLAGGNKKTEWSSYDDLSEWDDEWDDIDWSNIIMDVRTKSKFKL